MPEQETQWTFKEAIGLPFPDPTSLRDQKIASVQVGLSCLLFASAFLFVISGLKCLYYSVMSGFILPEFEFNSESFRQLSFSVLLLSGTFVVEKLVKFTSLEGQANRENKRWLKTQSKYLRRVWFQIHFGPARVSIDFDEYRLSWKKPESKNGEYYAEAKFCKLKYLDEVPAPRVRFPKARYKIDPTTGKARVDWGRRAIVELPPMY